MRGFDKAFRIRLRKHTESGRMCNMKANIPSAAEVIAELSPLTYSELEKLSKLSGVSFHTLLKIRDAETKNPRLDTVRQFIKHIKAARVSA